VILRPRPDACLLRQGPEGAGRSAVP